MRDDKTPIHPQYNHQGDHIPEASLSADRLPPIDRACVCVLDVFRPGKRLTDYFGLMCVQHTCIRTLKTPQIGLCHSHPESIYPYTAAGILDEMCSPAASVNAITHENKTYRIATHTYIACAELYMHHLCGPFIYSHYNRQTRSGGATAFIVGGSDQLA